MVSAPAQRGRPGKVGRSEGDRPLPVLPALEPLFPAGGLRRGSAVTVRGSASLLLALLAGPSRRGAWCGVVGLPGLGLVAAAEAGVELERLALVPDPGRDWAAVAAALLDAMEVVVVAPRGRVPDGDVRRLAARARQRGAVLVPYGSVAWPGAELRLSVGGGVWEGLGDGSGRLRSRRVVGAQRGARVGGPAARAVDVVAGPGRGDPPGPHPARRPHPARLPPPGADRRAPAPARSPRPPTPPASTPGTARPDTRSHTREAAPRPAPRAGGREAGAREAGARKAGGHGTGGRGTGAREVIGRGGAGCGRGGGQRPAARRGTDCRGGAGCGRGGGQRPAARRGTDCRGGAGCGRGGGQRPAARRGTDCRGGAGCGRGGGQHPAAGRGGGGSPSTSRRPPPQPGERAVVTPSIAALWQDATHRPGSRAPVGRRVDDPTHPRPRGPPRRGARIAATAAHQRRRRAPRPRPAGPPVPAGRPAPVGGGPPVVPSPPPTAGPPRRPAIPAEVLARLRPASTLPRPPRRAAEG